MRKLFMLFLLSLMVGGAILVNAQGGDLRAGIWAGGDPYVSFEVTVDGAIRGFRMVFPFGQTTCDILLDDVALDEDGHLTISMFSGGLLISGVFDTATGTTLTGTYSVSQCGRTISTETTTGEWAAEWVSEPTVNQLGDINGKIAFISDEAGENLQNIYVIEANGSGRVNLTESLGWVGEYWEFEWSPDGERIVFSHGADGIAVVNADGSNPTQLISAQDGPCTSHSSEAWSPYSSPAWSPDGEQIAFGCTDGLHVMNADGSGQQHILNEEPGTHTYVLASWSPDGTKILFAIDNPTRGRDEVAGVYVVNDDGTDLMMLSDLEPITRLAWSPDGSYIIFDASTGTSRVFVMNADGAELTDLIGGNYPDWGPDDQIVFVSSVGGVEHFMSMNTDVTNAVNIAEGWNRVGEFDWSPTGEWFVFVAWSGRGANDIYVMNADGTSITNLTYTSYQTDYQPKWQP